MKRMILTRLTLSGAGKADAILNFKKGLNVVTGDSDTGKTFAFQCINYVLGGERPPKNIVEANGYSEITLDFSVDDESYRIKRTLESSKVCIEHNNQSIEMQYKHDAKNANNLSRYLLKLLQGHSENAFLVKNSSNEKRTLSFRDLIRLVTVDETDIIAEGSSFQSIQHTEKTARKSVLKYIITGVDDRTAQEIDDVEDENLRRAGVVQFLSQKRDTLKEKITAIEEDESYRLYMSADTIQQMVEEIKQLRDSISVLNEQITYNQSQIDELKKNSFEDEAKVLEFERLDQHYAEELKRIGVVSTYADFLQQLPHLNCPICNQPISPDILNSDDANALFEYFHNYTSQLKSKVHDLAILIDDIKERLVENNSQIQHLTEENSRKSQLIAEQQATLLGLNKNIAIIRQLDAMKKSLEIYRQELASVEMDIIAYGEKVKKPKKAKDKTATTIYRDYCLEIENVLKQWGFSENIDVAFDADTLDLFINGKARSSWGKGYRAFILTAMVIGLMRYCFKNNRLHPGFVMLDSPLVSLKERKKDESGVWVTDYMEQRMIEDILKEDGSHQVIIFENKDIKYGYDYNYIDFKHDDAERKGFIPSNV